MTRACLDAGLEPPRLEELGTRFRVTLFAERKHEADLDEIDQRILEILERNDEGLSTSEIASHIDRSNRATRSRLRSLIDRALVAEVGMGRHDPRRRYHLIRDDR